MLKKWIAICVLTLLILSLVFAKEFSNDNNQRQSRNNTIKNGEIDMYRQENVQAENNQAGNETELKWYKTCVHAHTDMSDGHYWIKEQALQYVNNSYDVLWITDHEMSMATWMAWHGNVKNGDFERALNDPANEGGKAIWLTKHEGAPASIEIVQRTNAKANTGYYSIYLKEVAGSPGSNAQGAAIAYQQNDDFGFANLMWYGGMSFTFAIFPTSSFAPGNEARVTVYSYELIRGWEPFRIVFRAAQGTTENKEPYRPDATKPWIVYYDINEPVAGQWTVYTVNLTEIAQKALGSTEMMLREVHLSAVSSGRQPCELYFDSVKWERIDEMTNDQKFNAIKNYIENLNKTLRMRVYTGLEFSGSHHINGFCLPKYYYSNEYKEQECIDWVHNNGGFAAVNHVNGTSAGGLLHNTLEEVREKKAWGADFVELDGIDQSTLDLWDDLLQYRHFTGILGNDDHGNCDGSVFMNPDAVWILCKSDYERDLMESLQNGSAFFGNMNYKGIASVRDANSGRLYSRNPINTSGNAEIDIVITNLTPGSIVRINRNGDYLQTYPISESIFKGTFSFEVPKANTYFRVEAWNEKGHFLVGTNPIYFNQVAGVRPESPVLSKPGNGSSYDSPTSPEFEWSGNAQSYYIVVAEDENFAKPVIERHVNSTKYTPQFVLKGGKTYYWKVSSYDGTLYSKPSQIYSFTIAGIDTNVELLLPQNGSTLPSGLVSFTWTGTPRSNNYLYKLYLDSTTASTEVYSGIATEYSLQEALAQGTYYWKVSLIEGDYTVTSPIFTFTISGASARALNLLLPANGSVLESRNVKFEWTGTQLDGLRFELFVGDKINSMRSSWSGTSRSAILSLELKENVTYFWCVKGKNSDGRYVISSDIYSFTYRPAFAPVATLCAPLPGSIVGVSNIELIYDATDPDTPKDEINFKLYLDETNATTLIYEGKDRKHLVNLENGKKYYWRVEASDGKKKHITEAWNFTTDANMQLQALPEITLIKPRDCEKINESNVTFSWSTSSGKNSNLKYKLYLDSTEGNSIYAETNRTNLNVSLSYGMYFWKVEVENGAIGRISEIRHFFVTVYNESTPPTIPMLIEPSDGDVFAKNEVNFVVISQDPNGRGISYIFQFASNPTFNNARSETSNSGEITISFDAGTYYWRVKASNGVTDSAWSRTQTFTIDTSQSGLGVVLISPENGSKVKTLTTRLVWSINTRANALYKVYLSEDQAAVLNCRESACIRENTYQSNITSGFLKNGKRYYWTVVPVANRAWGICRSGVFYFDTEIPSSQFDVKASARSVSVGDEVTIKAEISQDLLPEGNIEYYFDFGDGTNSGWISNNSVTHKFGTSGKYNVKVKARSNAGGVWTETSEYKTEVSVSGGLCGTLIWYGAVFVLTLFVCTVSSKYAQKNRKERGKKFFKRIFTRRKEAKKRRKMRRR